MDDRFWEGQKQIVASFDHTVEKWLEGEVSYDEVLDEIQRLEEDEDVHTKTYNACMKIWNRAQQDDSFWKDEELGKWNELNKDQ